MAEYRMHKVPDDLWVKVKVKAASERMSILAVILTLLREWVEK